MLLHLNARSFKIAAPGPDTNRENRYGKPLHDE
jgi:hypothetical protein